MSDNIFEALRESHEVQRSLMRRLRLSEPGARRQEIFRLLRIELAAHEAAEERYLYVEILMDDRGLHPARDALADHHKMDEIVQDLRARDCGDRGWMSAVKKLSKELYEHLREEETIFFQVSGRILSASDKVRLARGYHRNYREMHVKLAAP